MIHYEVTAFAPATVANVAVGFDILGFPLDAIGDRVTLNFRPEPGIEIVSITGEPWVSPEDLASLPLDSELNAATVGLLAMMRDRGLDFGFRMDLKKGIAMGSGMGGSAASAVAALIAGGAFLTQPLSPTQLLEYALMGEQVASGAPHPDNVTPCLFGGLTLATGGTFVKIPTPPQILCVVVHPHLQLETRASRAVLKPDVSLQDHVRQSSLLAGFVAGCYSGDIELIRRSLKDCLIEPQRKGLIPGFEAAQAGALAAGALGCSISGSGPSMFAWAATPEVASAVQASMEAAFSSVGCDSWTSPISQTGARLL